MMNTKIYDLDSDPVVTTQESKNDSVESISNEIIKQISNIDPGKGIFDGLHIKIPQYEYLDVLTDVDFDEMVKYPELSRIYVSKNKKYKVPGKILIHLTQKTATTFQLSKYIEPKLTMKSFNRKSVFFTKKVENKIVSLNRILKPRGYFIRTQKGVYELAKI